VDVVESHGVTDTVNVVWACRMRRSVTLGHLLSISLCHKSRATQLIFDFEFLTGHLMLASLCHIYVQGGTENMKHIYLTDIFAES